MDLYRRALTHKSVLKHVKWALENNRVVLPYMTESFERMEYLGDACLNLVTGNLIFDRYPDKDEGFMTRLRTKLVRSSTCVVFAKKIGLGRHVLTAANVVRIKDADGVVINDKVLEDSFEALIGAIYKDLGFSYVELFLLKLINENINFDSLIANDDNFKDIIMRFTQSNGYELPIYDTVSVEGPPYNRIFTVKVSLKKGIPREFELVSGPSTIPIPIIIHKAYDRPSLGLGTGPTKKEAEQNACKNCICHKNKCLCKKIHMNDISAIINRVKTKNHDKERY